MRLYDSNPKDPVKCSLKTLGHNFTRVFLKISKTDIDLSRTISGRFALRLRGTEPKIGTVALFSTTSDMYVYTENGWYKVVCKVDGCSQSKTFEVLLEE